MLSLTHQCHSVINQCHPYISLFKAASLIAIKELPKYKALSLIVWAQPLHGTFLFDPGISIDKYTVKSCVILIIWLRQKDLKGNVEFSLFGMSSFGCTFSKTVVGWTSALM